MSADSRIVLLGSVATWLSGGTPDRANATYWSGSVPWISAATLKAARVHDSDQCITEAAVRAGSKLAPEGATLVLVRGMALRHEIRASLATRPVSFNQDVKALVPKPGILPAYLTYSILARRTAILDLVSSAGSGTGVLDTALLKRLPIWLPEVGEQQEIIEAIDDSEASYDLLKRAIAKKQAMKQGMMQELLTGRTRLPGFGHAWKMKAISDVADFRSGVSFDMSTLSQRSEVNPVPVFGGNGIAGYASLATNNYPAVILGRVGQKCGAVYHSAGAAWITDNALYASSFKCAADIIFLSLALELADLNKSKNSNDLPLITQSILRDVKIPWTDSPDEQQAIAAILADADREIDALRLSLAKALAVKQGMMEQLLTGRTRLAVQE